MIGEHVEKLLGKEEVANILGIPPKTLYSWRHRGEGPPAIRVGRHLRWTERSVAAWIEQKEGTSA